MAECDIITVGANSVHPKRQMVFDDTKISTKNTLISSLITSLLWSLGKWGFVYYVFYNQTYKSIYGQISILLFLMLWIYVSWIVILSGMRSCEGFMSNFGKKLEQTFGEVKI